MQCGSVDELAYRQAQPLADSIRFRIANTILPSYSAHPCKTKSPGTAVPGLVGFLRLAAKILLRHLLQRLTTADSRKGREDTNVHCVGQTVNRAIAIDKVNPAPPSVESCERSFAGLGEARICPGFAFRIIWIQSHGSARTATRAIVVDDRQR